MTGLSSLNQKHAPSILIFEDLDRLVASPGVSLSYFLNRSVATLRKQRKVTAKEQESLVERDNIGFSIRRRPIDFDEPQEEGRSQ